MTVLHMSNEKKSQPSMRIGNHGVAYATPVATGTRPQPLNNRQAKFKVFMTVPRSA
jgi:hypothetical protein